MTDVPIIDSPRAHTRERDRWQPRHRVSFEGVYGIGSLGRGHHNETMSANRMAGRGCKLGG